MGKNPGLGIGLSVLGSLCTALGYTFQKLAHRRADASAEAAAREAARSGERAGPSGLSEDVSTVEGEVTQRSVPKAPRGTPYYRFWQFPAGLAMLILGSVVGVVTFGLAGQAELAPMSAVTLVWNELLSWRILRERFTRIDAISVALMAGGTTLALVFARSSGAEYATVDAIMELLDRPGVYAFCVISAASMVAAAYLVSRWGRIKPAELPPLKAAGDAAGRAFVGGMLGGFTGFLVKALVEVISSSVGGGDWSVFTRWQIYLLVSLLVLVLANQLRYMNSGLARWDSNRVIPIYQSTLVFSGVLCGYVLWDEVAVQTTQSLLLFGAGCVLTIGGVAVLGLKPPQVHGVNADGNSSDSGRGRGRSRGASLEMMPLTADAALEHERSEVGSGAAAMAKGADSAIGVDDDDAADDEGIRRGIDTRAIDVAAISSGGGDGYQRKRSATATGTISEAQSQTATLPSTTHAGGGSGSARGTGRLSARSTGSSGSGAGAGPMGHVVDGVLAVVRPRPAPRTSQAGALIEALEVLAAAASGSAIDPELSSATRDDSGAPARRAGPRFFAGDDDDDDSVAGEDRGDGELDFDGGSGSGDGGDGGVSFAGFAPGAHPDAASGASVRSGNNASASASASGSARNTLGFSRDARPSSSGAGSSASAARGGYGGRGSRTLSRVDCPYGALESPPPAGRSARQSTVSMAGLGSLGNLSNLSGLDDEENDDDERSSAVHARAHAHPQAHAQVQVQPRMAPPLAPPRPAGDSAVAAALLGRIPPASASASASAAAPRGAAAAAAAPGTGGSAAGAGAFASGGAASARRTATATATPSPPPPAPVPAISQAAGKRQSVSWSLSNTNNS